jgi:hypothetical protein
VCGILGAYDDAAVEIHNHRQVGTELRAVGCGLRTDYNDQPFVDAWSRPLASDVCYRQQGRD